MLDGSTLNMRPRKRYRLRRNPKRSFSKRAIRPRTLPSLLSSSQPLPDKVGILNGKYLVGSNESHLIYLTSFSEYRLISMVDLDRVCQVPAESSAARDAELIQASVPFEVRTS